MDHSFQPRSSLVCIARDPAVRLRDIAADLNIPERRSYDIVQDLSESGCVVKEIDGRRNRHEIQDHLPLREDLGREQEVGEAATTRGT
jgi:hypothetical protein